MSGETVSFQWLDGGTVTSPRGFKAGSIYAGLKTPGADKRDVGIILSDAPCSIAGVFTQNKVAAAPVIISRERVKRGIGRGIVFNAGNANAATGEVGLQRAQRMAELAAARIGVSPDDLMVASTGVIGVPLPIEKFQDGIERVEISYDGGHDAAQFVRQQV